MNIAYLTGSLRTGGAESILATVANRTPGCVAVLTLDHYDDNWDQALVAKAPTTICGLDSVKKIYDVLLTLQPHILVACGERAEVLGVSAARKARVPHVVFMRQGYARSPNTNILWRVKRALANVGVSRVVTPTHALAAFVYASECYLKQDKIMVINNAVESVQVQSRTPRDPLAISVGNIRRTKAYDVLINAFTFVKPILRPNLHIIGEDRGLQKSLQTLIDRHGLQGYIQFIGHCNNDEIRHRLAGATFYIQSSRSEGFCNATLEAMSAGLPVIVSSAGGLPEVVGNAGLIFENESPVHLAQKIEAVMESSERRALMREKSLEQAKLFSVERMVGEYIKLYNDLLKGG